MKSHRIFFKSVLGILVIFIVFSFGVTEKKPKTKIFTDSRDGQEYVIIKIGKQWWFAQNLNYETEKSWCHECKTYGRMYTYEAALEACPEGWHVPSVEEWKELITTLGGEEIAGGKMKSIEKWKKPGGGVDNHSGFSAIPAPNRGTTGEIRYPREAVWWTSDKAPEPAAWTVKLKQDETGVYHYGFYRVSGFSVRCVKD